MPLFCAESANLVIPPILIMLLHQPADVGVAGGASLQAAAPAA